MVVTAFCNKLTTTNLTPLRWLKNIWWPVVTPGGTNKWGGYWRQSTGGGFCIIWWEFCITGGYRRCRKGCSRQHQKQWAKYTMSHNITREYSDYPYC